VQQITLARSSGSDRIALILTFKAAAITMLKKTGKVGRIVSGADGSLGQHIKPGRPG
jgi:hypothetical protein